MLYSLSLYPNLQISPTTKGSFAIIFAYTVASKIHPLSLSLPQITPLLRRLPLFPLLPFSPSTPSPWPGITSGLGISARRTQ